MLTPYHPLAVRREMCPVGWLHARGVTHLIDEFDDVIRSGANFR